MIETEQIISIDASLAGLWGYVNDIEKWASLMPGCLVCTVISPHDSRWTLKVGVGGLVRTVKVLVHIDRWDGPQRVDFSYTLEGDPVKGGGSYSAVRKAARETEVTLTVRVEGGGPLAPMWEAMCKPLLPQLARVFAGKLKAQIEQAADAPASQDAAATDASSVFAAGGRRLGKFWRAIQRQKLKA